MSIDLQPGKTLSGGRYTIVMKIGEGGFSITYRAVQNGLNRIVCIKEYFPSVRCTRDDSTNTVKPQDSDLAVFEKYRQSFRKEAETLSTLHHNSIVEVVDVFDENNTSYMVMPFVEGRTLQQIVDQEGPLDYPQAVNYLAQVADAVAYIHERHILHRDIKPENIIITADYRAILIDFGSAREFVNDKTQAHTSILTHGYAPTEQYSTNSRKGFYTDIYALGATFYFVLTGKVPLDAVARMTDEMVEPQTLNPAIPDEANRTILKAMQMKASDRHQTVQEFMDDLRNVKRPRHATRQKSQPVEMNQDLEQTTVLSAQKIGKKKFWKPWMLWVLVALVVGVALVLGIVAGEKSEKEEDAVADSTVTEEIEEVKIAYPAITSQGVGPFILGTSINDIPTKDTFYDTIIIKNFYDAYPSEGGEGFWLGISEHELKQLRKEYEQYGGIDVGRVFYVANIIKDEDTLMVIECSDKGKKINSIEVRSDLFQMESGVRVGMTATDLYNNYNARFKTIPYYDEGYYPSGIEDELMVALSEKVKNISIFATCDKKVEDYVYEKARKKLDGMIIDDSFDKSKNPYNMTLSLEIVNGNTISKIVVSR